MVVVVSAELAGCPMWKYVEPEGHLRSIAYSKRMGSDSVSYFEMGPLSLYWGHAVYPECPMKLNIVSVARSSPRA